MRVIENFFFTPHRSANILKVTSCPSQQPLYWGLSKQRSLFASDDVLIVLSAFTSLQN
jgi:hypothetical protein